MKKIFATIMAVMLIVLAGCSGNKEIPIEDQAKRAVLGEWKATAMYLGDESYDPSGTTCIVKDGLVFSMTVNDTNIDFDNYAYDEEDTNDFRESFPEEEYPTLYAFTSREDSTSFLYYVRSDNTEGLLMGIPASSTTETVITLFARK